MKVHELRSPNGAKRGRKRVGRGDAAGQGSYSGRGMKGQNARSGGGVRPGFEGGQLPIIKRLPHIRGFKNRFRTQYSVVNLKGLSGFPADSEVTPEVLVEAGILNDVKRPVKVLGDGNIAVALTIVAHKFSGSARQKIEAAGGSVRELE